MSAKLSSKNFYGGNLMVKCFVALVIFFCSVGNLFAQTETKVTINVDKVLIRTALERLQKETKVHFVYDEENIDQDKRVSLSYTQAPLKIVLEDFCKQTSLRYEVKRNLILILPGKADRNVNRQSFLMKGVVTDEDGESIIGATVMIGGTSKGTVTDINGQYTLEVQSGDLVSFTFVGMTDKVIKAQVNKKMVNVQLESNATALADVVITGYQTLSKERATGSFDKVDSSVLSSRPTADLSTALQGLVAGMQATEKEDGSIDFLIRGSSSLYADKKPLLVVDGFPIQGDFSSINPNDVESVTVLKDAAAASIWGARSANGVIVVTTKKGKKDKVQVDVQAFVRIGTNPDLEYIMNQADSRTMVDYEMRAFENNWKMAAWEYAPIFSKIQNSLTLAQELYYANKYQGLSKEEMEQGLERLRNTSNRQQLKDYLMQTQLLQQYNVSISGGTERMSNYMSLMYEKNDESTIKRGYEKFMINYNNSYKVTKWLTANLITTLQRKDQETSGVTIGEFSNLSPYEMLLNEDGSYATNLNVYNRAELEKLPLEKLPYSDWSYNMLREVRGREYKTTNTMYRVQLGLNAQIIKGLNYDMRVQYESTSSEYKNYDSEDTFYARNLVNSYTEYNNETQEVGVSRIPKGGVLRSGKTEYSKHECSESIYASIDREALTKIISNLFTNAIKYSETYIHVRLWMEDTCWFLSVCNDGNVIPMEMREEIFKPFIQYKDGFSRKVSGTGIGLALARSLAELHEGNLIMDDSQKQNCFILSLPVKHEHTIAISKSEIKLKEDPKEEDPGQLQQKPRYTVLIVEDNVEMLAFVVRQLSPVYQILTATNGVEALKVLEGHTVNLIVSDIMMPEMDGLELCDRIKSDLDYSHIPIVLLTAKTTLQSKIDGLKSGADAYIEKPFSVEYLKVSVANLLSNHEKLHAAFAHSPFIQTNSMAMTKADETFLKTLNEVIVANMQNPDFCLDDMASLLNMSRSSLNRKIKGVLDMTPNDYIRLERLKKAAQLLREGECKVNEVCYMVGFNTPSYFTKCFQKQFGILPKDFVK